LDKVEKLGIFPITRDPAVNQIVVVQTVHRFKGLERAVVILADVDELSPAHLDQVMYVGLTRARVHAIVVHVPAGSG
jgi:superfamily I DNA/RNA helicase